MRVNVELEKLLEMLADIASEAKDEARIKFEGAQADAVTLGIAFLLESVGKALSGLEEYNLSPETGAQVLRKTVSRYCLRWCECSREQAPGTHDRCPSCPLMPFTVGAVENVVEKVMEDEV